MEKPHIKNGWFTEFSSASYGQTYKATEHLVNEQTEYQKLDVIRCPDYGKILLLDGRVMLTQADEFIYHEMIAHIPLLVHPNPRRVLVVGGGDGGAIREILKHPEVEQAVLCEIDGRVIEVCREHFPEIACGLDDPRAQVLVRDGIEYMAQQTGGFDVIIIDSTDPIGPAVGLFESPFLMKVKQALGPGGFMVNQCEGPLIERGEMVGKIAAHQRAAFDHVNHYWAGIHTYPTALWLFGFCSDTAYDLNRVDGERAEKIGEQCIYYTPQIQQAAFALPRFVSEVIDGNDIIDYARRLGEGNFQQ